MSNKLDYSRHGAVTPRQNRNDLVSVSKGSRPTKQTVAPPRVRTSNGADKSSSIERLPPEVLIKMLSYLDASDLVIIGHVNKLLHRLANDDALWKRIYLAQFGKSKKLKPEKTGAAALQEGSAGGWKRLYVAAVATRHTDKWKRHLRLISGFTGLPRKTEQILRNLRVTWELTASDKSGHVSTHEPSWTRFSETSVAVCWNGGGCLSNYQQISTLQLHGVERIALNYPGLKKSLMERLDMQTLAKSAPVVGQDRLVELKLLQPGVIIGVWRAITSQDQCSVAFVMLTLHFHRLVERSIQGSSVCPHVEPAARPPFDDVDPEYGLHGYRLHFALHDTVCKIMSESFAQLYCRRTQISDGLVQLTAISRTAQHIPLSGSITLPWMCEALQGAVQNCCIMDLTLLDEFEKPFWCVSSAVPMRPDRGTHAFQDSDEEHFLLHYADADGQVKVEIMWMKEQQQFFLQSLVVWVAVCKVNKHFNKDY